jgi:pyruvate-formate lyase-activating enzyme
MHELPLRVVASIICATCQCSTLCSSTSRAVIRKPIASRRAARWRRRSALLSGSPIGKPVWVRVTLVLGLADDLANVEKIAKFAVPMKNVEWVEVQPFHQLGAFKWKAMGLDYKEANTISPATGLHNMAASQLRRTSRSTRPNTMSGSYDTLDS